MAPSRLLSTASAHWYTTSTTQGWPRPRCVRWMSWALVNYLATRARGLSRRRTNTVTENFTPEDVTANGVSRGLYLHPTSKFQALSKKVCLATLSNYWSGSVRQDIEAIAIPLAPRPVWRVFPNGTRLMRPTMFGRRSSLRARLVDYNGCLVFCLVGCLLFSLGLCFWPLFGGWRDGVFCLWLCSRSSASPVGARIERLYIPTCDGQSKQFDGRVLSFIQLGVGRPWPV
jgi:hypothetical protein